MDVLRATAKLLPINARSWAKRIVFKNRHWAHPDLKQFGTVQDLYYWISDGDKDTVLVLQNFYSAFYPTLDTSTRGTVAIYDQNGGLLIEKSFKLAHSGAVKLRVSALLEDLPSASEATFGTLEVKLAIPREVITTIQESRSFYFWDRFYIGYTNKLGQTCFVHGVDKTNIYREGRADPVDWYKKPKDHQWAPETPVDIADYHKYDVILINRTSETAATTLTLLDVEDRSLSWQVEIPPKGVRRFELDQHKTASLNPNEMRMLVTGMATQFGRPMIFKEFRNGAISAMHC
ncbi:hypothetical protein FIM07_01350 [SAR202 cluster bacterium AD-802-F09_MRT_200m]|nr:hypothetical protein [SAR202 cluster bacterium AD-802-F09_MRT_200m]